MSNYGVVLFHNTTSVMRAERAFRNGGLAIKLIPTPREFSSDCGMAIRFDWQDEARVRALLDQARVEVAGLHSMG